MSVPGLHLGSAAQSSMILARARNKDALPAFSAICVYIQGKPAQSLLIKSSLFSDIDLKIKRLKIYNHVTIRKMRLISFSILTLTALRIKKNVRKTQRWVFDYLVKFYLTYIIWLASCHDRTLICTRL